MRFKKKKKTSCKLVVCFILINISYYHLLLAYYLKVILRVSTYAQHVTK